MRTVFISIFTLFVFFNSIAQSSDSRELKLLSWNTYMLPAFPMFTGQKKRAKGMVAVLKDGQYDIICLQEAYHKGFRRIISKGLKEQYPFQIIAKPKTLSPTSGLWILSKQPIHKIKEIEFVAKKKVEGSKGAILFEMDGLDEFHFIVTHMQSGDGVEKTAIREDQSIQIQKELVTPYLYLNKTVVFAGDWNMEAGSAFDNVSLRRLYNITFPKSMPTKYTWPSPAFSKHSKSYLLDLIMLFCPNDDVSDFETGIPNLKYEWKKGKSDLSDHMPVAAWILLKK